MKNITFTLLALIGIISLNAQTTGQIATYNSFSADGGVTDALLNYADGSYAEKNVQNLVSNDSYIQGSPYTSNTFSSTPLYYKDDAVGSVFYRYNALNEEIEIMKTNAEGEVIQSLAKDKKLNIRPNGKKMSFKTFITSSNRTTNGYLTELISGKKYDLYKRTHVKFNEGEAARNTFSKPIPARFVKFTDFYFQKNGTTRIDQVAQQKGKFLNLLDHSSQEAVKDYLKKNSLKLKTEADIVQVFEFLNSL